MAMYASCLLLACMCAFALAKTAANYSLDNASSYFDDFITKFNKRYHNDTDKETHYQVFKKNLEIVNQLNSESNGRGASFGITKFMDLELEEYKSLTTSIYPKEITKVIDLEQHEYKSITTTTSIYPKGIKAAFDRAPPCERLEDKNLTAEGAPDSFDWRTRNVVTSVKDQQTCSSCFTFSATGQLEGQYALKYKELVDLSPQQIVDCDTVSWGCRGGEITDAFHALMKLGGSMKETDYPYKDTRGLCVSDPSKAVIKVSKCFSYTVKSQERLKQWLYKTGPIAVAVQGEALEFYTGGIISDAQCDKGKVSHAVLLVGYGTEDGMQYWTAKNSEGTSFGEDGYFRMQRGEDAGSCGMMNDYMSTAEIEK